MSALTARIEDRSGEEGQPRRQKRASRLKAAPSCASEPPAPPSTLELTAHLVLRWTGGEENKRTGPVRSNQPPCAPLVDRRVLALRYFDESVQQTSHGCRDQRDEELEERERGRGGVGREGLLRPVVCCCCCYSSNGRTIARLLTATLR